MLLLLILLPLAWALPLLLTRSESESGLGRWSCAVTGLTLLVMVLAVCTRFGESLDIPLCGIHFTLDGFRAIYGLVVSFMWFVSALLTPQYFRGHHHLRRYHFFFLLCLSFTMGVFLSADLYTTFLFFELMSLSSYAWVVQEESPDALDAGKTYLTIAVLGGLVTLMGCYQGEGVRGKLQHGSAWWFNDCKEGMEAQLKNLAAGGVLGNFIGMLTDSRSFL